MLKKSVFFLLLSSIFYSTYAQDDDAWENEEETDSSYLFVGVNVNAFFANRNTAFLYNGSPNVTPFGIEYIIFQVPQNRQFFDDFFQYSYQFEEYPLEPRYRSTVEFGLHLGYQFSKNVAVFADVNAFQLDYEQQFTIAVDDPNNGTVGPTFQRFGLFGEESRFHFNLGAQMSIYNDELGNNFYLPIFAHLNAVQMEQNYFIINNRRFDIAQDFNVAPNGKLGGVDYGFGSGLGFRFHVTESIQTDFNYTLIYNSINMRDDFQAKGFHHSVGIKILWIK